MIGRRRYLLSSLVVVGSSGGGAGEAGQAYEEPKVTPGEKHGIRGGIRKAFAAFSDQ
jgi:hypothetical protein